MNTPICDFVRKYGESRALRLHMPGHKGCSLLGMEELDITEITGADSLYEAEGIIRESEQNAGALFGCSTFYSTEGSSQCIRAMMYLAALEAKRTGRRMKVAAGRNAHKTFLSAAALMDFEVEWLYPKASDSYLSCRIDADDLERALSGMEEPPTAVYLTSPDYLGNMIDVRSISAVCRHYGVMLLIDSAHGAYLKFLPESHHPMDLGADMCCASAHKTLPALTGGAYLHISSAAPQGLISHAKRALSMFGSTSPSYLILQSLDAVNRYLADGYRERLKRFIEEVDRTKAQLQAIGYTLCGDEPIKLTIDAKKYGYMGNELAEKLYGRGVVCEFADPDFLVLMVTPETGAEGLAALVSVLSGIRRRGEISRRPPLYRKAEQVMSIREAAMSACETIRTEDAAGRVLAAATVGCPPAVPILVSGELIDSEDVERFQYYGINTCDVVCE